MKPVLSPYRYVICFCSCLLIFMSVGLLSNAFPIYFPFIMKEHQFSNTQLSLLTTMRSVTALICMFFTDRYYARLNLKSGILLALSCGIISFVIYGITDSSESGPQLLFLERLRVTTGHSIEEVSSVLALLGGMLILGKCAFGLVSDRFGSSNALICYGLLLLSGQTLCCFSAVSGPLLLRLTLVFFGLGAAIPGVSIPILTADLCSPADYAKTLKNYQITYTLGGLLTSTLPGILADLTGSYLTSHVLFVFCAAGILLFLVPVHK
ncbi:MAG: MFS transporter [Clostridium sp.]|nr:MFS transporter [Clostridium sp.]